uniref:AB hydrolase-1 domain-containing protein n=2 Tax=Oryza brachyantha TaxID=4533 RepID=J3N163_ORYBR
MAKVVRALEGVGYKEGVNLFGAPYDFRYAPAPPGKNATVFSSFVADLRRLLEHASRKNGGKPAILVTHSFGGVMAVEFLTRSTAHVKHLVMTSTGAGGVVVALGSLAASASAPPLSMARTARSYATAFLPVPSPAVFGDAPLVVTRRRNYSAHDMAEFLAAVGFSDEEIGLYRARALPVTLGLGAPRVPTTAINGVGVATPEQLVYWDGDFSKAPEVVYGDGDGVINLASALALDTMIGDNPEQSFFKSVKIANVTHGGMITEELALKRVISEILEANRANYRK